MATIYIRNVGIETARQLKSTAARLGLTIKQAVLEAIQDWLNKKGKL